MITSVEIAVELLMEAMQLKVLPLFQRLVELHATVRCPEPEWIYCEYRMSAHQTFMSHCAISFSLQSNFCAFPKWHLDIEDLLPTNWLLRAWYVWMAVCIT